MERVVRTGRDYWEINLKLLVDNKGQQWAKTTTVCVPPSKFKGKNVPVIKTLMEPKKSPSFQSTILSQQAQKKYSINQKNQSKLSCINAN